MRKDKKHIPKQHNPNRPAKREREPDANKPARSLKPLREVMAHVQEAITELGEGALLQKVYDVLEEHYSESQVTTALAKLDTRGVITLDANGKIKILKDEKDEAVSSFREKKPEKRGPAKGHDEPRTGKAEPKGDIRGRVDLTKTGAAYVIVDAQWKDIYINNRYVNGALNGDEVMVEIFRPVRNKPEGKIVSIVKRSRESFSGKIQMQEKFAFLVADDEKLPFDIFIPAKSLMGAKNQQRVIVRVTDWGRPGKNPSGEVVEIIEGARASDYDMKMILIQKGFHTEFPHDVLEELNGIKDEISAEEIKSRLDLRETLTFTIDPIDARDFDDAISVKYLDNGNFEIGVHIADVAHYIKEGSPLDREAEKRATSVYLPDRVCPMLPEKLSNELCSLRPNEDKLTFSTIFEFDSKFKVHHITIGKTIIHSNRRFTYEDAQEVIETGQGDHAEEILLLNAVSKSIRAKRFENGAIAFEKDEVRFRLAEDGTPLDLYVKTRKDAHLLVEDFMLLANETVAKFGSKVHEGKHYPFVYRIHDAPDEAKLKQFSIAAQRFGYKLSFKNPRQIAATLNEMLKKIEGKPEQHVLENLAIRTMAKAAYTTKNIGHYGLAIEHYTHFTSPIRRYPDVMVHRLVQELLTTGKHPLSADDLEARCKNSSVMERRAMEAEREATRYKQIEYLQDKLGTEYTGIVTGVIARGLFVEMEEIMCEGMIGVQNLGNEEFIYDEEQLHLKGRSSGRKFLMGDRLKVRLVSADLPTRKVDLDLIE